jgi:ATP-dependent phosphofructokinase / diphosphate-dependent phosphofructokinase
VHMLNKLGIKYMVTTGGDDTAYGASEIAKAASGKIKFAHVPKTIDNDLPLPNNIPTFGYETARNLGSILVKNLMEDAKTANRWYIAVAMGRHAGHLALGVAKSAGATVAIISEEFKEKPIRLSQLCDILETSILKRKAMGHTHGVLVIAEGVAEQLDPEELKKMQGANVEYDNYGHLRLAEVDLGKIIKEEMQKRFKEHKYSVTLVDINIGYVLRCADPIPYDQEYTRDLGYQAVRFLLSEAPEHQGNAMICVDNGVLNPIPFEQMIDPNTHKTAIRMVDVDSESYKVAKSYMVRLDSLDFEDQEFMTKIAQQANMSYDAFMKQFGYMAKK